MAASPVRSIACRAQTSDIPAAQESAQQSEQDQNSRPDNSQRKDLPDFGQVSPTLYRGAQASHEGFRKLAAMGVSIVVDLRGNRKSERKFVNSLGVTYVATGWECSFPKDKTFAEFLTLIRDNPGKTIFVHCRVDDDRTGMMIAAVRMADQGWSAEEAEKEMERFGFNFRHRRIICPRLVSYEEDFPKHFRNNDAFLDLREPKDDSKPN